MGGDGPSQMVALVRHGQAKSADEDPARGLTAAGRERVDRVAGMAAALGLALDEVRHSGKERARETAELFAARLGVAPTRVLRAHGLDPNDDVEAVADLLEVEGRSVALVGHLPFMRLLASRLVSGDPERLNVRFGDAGCLVVARDGVGWRLEALLNHELSP